MCDACQDALTFSDAFEGVYRRPLNAIELEHGDVDRVRADMDAAEQRVVRGSRAVIAKIVAQLIDELKPLVESGDVAGAAKVRPSYTGELAKSLKASSAAIVKAGTRQVRDVARKAGSKLATRPPKKDVRKAAAYLEAKNEAIAELVQAQIDASVKRTVLDAAATTVWSDEVAAEIAAEATRSLVASAYAVAREGYGIGRRFGYEEIKQDVAEVMYTAILDDRACEICLAMDGRLWVADNGDDLDEGFASAPNLDCLGGDRCRCYTVLVMR